MWLCVRKSEYVTSPLSCLGQPRCCDNLKITCTDPRSHTNEDQHPSGGNFLSVCSNGGGVNHPCPWPLAALISSEQWSRTRSISDAAGNDTSPAPPGPRPRKARRGPSVTASHCILAPHFSSAGRATMSQRKK